MKQIIWILCIILFSMQLHAESVPSITGQPQSKEVSEGDSVEFKVAAKNDEIGKKQDNFDIPLSGNVKLKMIRIKPGTFTMGSPKGESGRSDDEVQHQVTLTKDYWLGKYEVTQAQYKAIMGINPSRNYGIGDNYPVYYVSWKDAMTFCSKLTEIERKAGRLPEGYEYTLPTEAQWEYACRAGTTTALNSGKNLTSTSSACSNVNEVGWYLYNSNLESHPVGQKKSNAWGLYDMHGNVCELCRDSRVAYTTNPMTDPIGNDASNGEKALKGEGYRSDTQYCRSAVRNSVTSTTFRDQYVGFRVALSVVSSQKGRSISGSGSTKNLTYQWYKDGNIIKGATNPNYRINNVKPSDAGRYTVKVCNQAGCVTSKEAVLEIKGRIRIVEQPESQTINEGSTVTFSVTVTGTSITPLYQWYKDGEIIKRAIGSSYTIRHVKLSDVGKYHVKVINDMGDVISEKADLKVNEKIRITKQPESQTINEGSTVTFSVTVTGTDPQYQWYKDEKIIRKATDSIYTILHTKNKDVGKYKVKIHNSIGKVFSEEADLKVNEKSRITEQPKSQTVKEGDTVTFSVTVIGTDPQYQWYKDGEAIEGAIGSEYIIEEVISENAGTYSVRVSNELSDDVVSEMATLTIDVDSQNMNSPEEEESEAPLVIISQSEDNPEEEQPEDEGQPEKTVNKFKDAGENQSKDQSLKEGNSGAIIVKREGEPDIVIDMIWIKVKPTFLMGSPENELGCGDNETQHPVILTKNYWLGKYEVTQAQYMAITGENPSGFVGDNNPVERVSWNDAMEFCVKLTEIAGKAKVLPEGYKFMLPTEAQWEYACRADTVTALNNGKDLTDEFECPESDEVAWYWSNSEDSTHSAGQRKPNAWGLYDMHGNVWEWCLDGFTDFGKETVIDPYHKEDSCRVVRGGGWHSDAYSCRSASRDKSEPSARDDIYGFRLTLVPVQ